MITLTYTPWKPTFADASEPSPVKELTMTIGDGVTWEEATSEFQNFLRGAGYVIPYDFEMDEENEVGRLRQVCRNVYEVWAGSDGIPVPETCSEGYLLRLIEQMRDEAKAGLSEEKHA